MDRLKARSILNKALEARAADRSVDPEIQRNYNLKSRLENSKVTLSHWQLDCKWQSRSLLILLDELRF